MPWTLTGSDRQQALVRSALERIKFPFDRLSLPGSPELGWRDLNGGDDSWWMGAQARKHEAHHPPPVETPADRPEPLNGEVEGRKWVMGVFFPYSARIYLDLALEPYPDLVAAVVGAEIAHAVDEFLPLSEAQRAAITALLHPEGPDEHSWWEKADYGAEYYTLIGEEFMRLFVEAYSDIPFGDASDFAHGSVSVDPAAVRSIVGVERTDAVRLVRYGRSLVYHLADHYERRPGIPVVSLEGLRPCKVCRPPASI